ncbi:Pleckstrin homology domain [Trypanosoma melophagium]|uniref:Pleckstrin homology domain n=1 Tax=Trypanosoma melophagium TaxID=715481 RepID=UPI00351A29C9|nr:Pleckstrin homology domain [Trypanosoma melophagium]
MPEDVRSRLERFMGKYNPEKVFSIDAILKAYTGREEEMFKALVKKYGPEPPRDDAPLTNTKVEAVSATFDAEVLRSRLMRFFAQYAPEKLAGVDVLIESCERQRVEELMESFVSTYGPEPAEESMATQVNKNEKKKEALQREEDRGDIDDDDERRKLIAWMEASGRDAKIVCNSLLTEMELLDFVKANFGDYKGRIRCLFVRYDPARLETVPGLLEAYCGREDELIAWLTSELGPEPEKTAPTSLLRLMRRRADWRRIDEDTWTDDEANDDDEVLLLRPPKGLTDGRSLIESYQANDPGEFSGDESAAYPRDEEHWYRLFFGSGPADDGDVGGDDTVVGDSGSFCTHGDGTVVQTSPSGDSSAPSPSTSRVSRQQRMGCLQVTLGNKFGQAIGALCAPCSTKVARSFEALWQPVGPQYQQLLSETVVKVGYLEKLSSDGRRMGVKWQKRYFRVNDKGMHYYETNAPNEKPKGYKVFTKESTVVEHIDATAHPRCTDNRYHYFGITVNDSNDMFYLRTPSEGEKRQWVSFMKLAFARVRLTTVGCDQNPSQWRGRMDGLKEAEIGLIDLVHASSVMVQKLWKQHEDLKQRINVERAHRKLMETQLTELQERQAHLTQCVMEAKARAHAVEDDVNAKCLELAERTAIVKQQRLEMGSELGETRRSIDGITQTVINMQKEIMELERECEAREARVRQAYSKWRRCEERQSPGKNSMWRSS